MSKLWNRQNAPSVPDSEIQINSTIRKNRNNRYLLWKVRWFNELRNTRNEEVVTVNSILPIVPIQWVVSVITVIYTLSKRNAQVAGQHMRAVATWALISEFCCRSASREQFAGRLPGLL
jgi:hypothetical protein